MSKHQTNCDLATCFLCTHCQPQWHAAIAQQKRTLFLKKGERLFTEGNPVTGVYFILEGTVKVHKHWGDEKELIVRFAKEGDIVGLRAFAGPLLYPISATALEPSKVCFVPSDFLEASMKMNPAFTYELLHMCTTELQRSEKRMSDLAHMDVKGRLADTLFEAIDTFGEGKDGFIATTLSRQDIASYAGTTYETVFKVFTEWITAGTIATDGKRIKVADKKRLASFAL